LLACQNSWFDSQGAQYMSGQSLLVTLVAGGIAGWLAGLVLRGSGYGIIGDVVVGPLGSVVGSYLVNIFHVTIHFGNRWLDQGIIAFGGAMILLMLIGLLRQRTFGGHMRGWWHRR
jgi:uncharacterized membrane protein YeaQ/YmgE (transglycosylase-associated protein family)